MLGRSVLLPQRHLAANASDCVFIFLVLTNMFVSTFAHHFFWSHVSNRNWKIKKRTDLSVSVSVSHRHFQHQHVWSKDYTCLCKKPPRLLWRCTTCRSLLCPLLILSLNPITFRAHAVGWWAGTTVQNSKMLPCQWIKLKEQSISTLGNS